MRLESALFSSREGITAHGQAISVIGDNIANSNTTGFKASRAEFSDLLSSAGGPSSSTEALSSGSGVAVRQVRQLHMDGPVEFTGRSLDVAISGNGFFILSDGQSEFYSRAGNFGIDAQGFLINTEGLRVQGFGPDGVNMGPIDLFSFEQAARPTEQVSLFGNLGSTAEIVEPPADPQTFIEVGQGASMLTSVQVYDSLGEAHPVSVAFYKTDVNTWIARAYIEGSRVGAEEGVPVQLGADAVLTFNNAGMIDEGNLGAATIAANPNFANGAAQGQFEIDLSSFTQFAGSSQMTSITQDGLGVGNVKDFEIMSDGRIFAQLDSGINALIGTIPLATFPNVNGLQRIGNSLYAEGTDSGDRLVAAPGESSVGTLQGSALERSTVDIASQFVELVLFQRGYQANSQALNAASTLLRDTIHMLR